ncbi:MAG TPA: flagellar protein FlaG [Bacteroidota bacterium]|jgi:flagellar protein FlaG|nr:flagellar protein FlaG [Bacteroidota bacterium]
MIDTNNILATKPIQVVQEVAPALSSEKVSTEVKQQTRNATEQTRASRSSKKDTQFDSKVMDQLAKQLNEDLKIFNTRVSFSIDDKTKKTVVKIIDSSNNEVIKQVPPDYLLKISQRISELLGLLVDEKA